ncbi:MAG: 30S ribosomal protein S20 [Armatimonadetes bacterium]|nr:30S ribosomal protein S20 [Armatimonadota bacterium]
MPNKKASIKDLRQSEKRRQANLSVRTALKTYVKQARAAAGTDDAAERARLACKMLDKAAERGIIHKNQASRRKSRLVKHTNAGSG